MSVCHQNQSIRTVHMQYQFDILEMHFLNCHLYKIESFKFVT